MSFENRVSGERSGARVLNEVSFQDEPRKGARSHSPEETPFIAAGPAFASTGAPALASFWRGGAVAQVATGPQAQQRQIARALQKLKSRDDAVVEQATRDLVAIGPAAVLPVLTLLSTSQNVKDPSGANAIGVMMVMGSTAVPTLVEAALKHPNSAIRRDAAFMLTGPLGTDAVPALVPKLQDPDVNVRRVVAGILAQAFVNSPAEPARISALITALKNDQDPTVREKAAEGIGRVPHGSPIEPARAVALTAALKNDPEAKVREASIHSLGKLEAQTAIPTLIDVLNNDHEEVSVRAAAAGALGWMKASTAAPALMAALTQNQNSQRAPLRAAAAHALGELIWFGGSSPTCNAQAAFSALATGLKDPNPDVRKEAALALDHIHIRSSLAIRSTCSAASEALIPPLIDAVNNPQSAQAREAAAESLLTVAATLPMGSLPYEAGIKALEKARQRGLIKKR